MGAKNNAAAEGVVGTIGRFLDENELKDLKSGEPFRASHRPVEDFKMTLEPGSDLRARFVARLFADTAGFGDTITGPEILDHRIFGRDKPPSSNLSFANIAFKVADCIDLEDFPSKTRRPARG